VGDKEPDDRSAQPLSADLAQTLNYLGTRGP